jgi:hypothetical protein
MPAPLATPVTRIMPPSFAGRVRELILGRVSVVMMPRSKGSQLPATQAPARAGMAAVTRSMGRRCPMTPVEFTSTAAGVQSHAAATASIMACASAAPWGPVAALAHPEFTTSAMQRPRESRRLRRLARIGAAANAFVVNMAAAAAPPSHRSSERSGPPLALMPAATLAEVKPRGKGGAWTVAAAGMTQVTRRAPRSGQAPSPPRRTAPSWGMPRSPW